MILNIDRMKVLFHQENITEMNTLDQSSNKTMLKYIEYSTRKFVKNTLPVPLIRIHTHMHVSASIYYVRIYLT